jgi:hypothetical protein
MSLPGAVFHVRSPRRTARRRGIKKRPAHDDTARSPSPGVHTRDAPYSARRGPRRPRTNVALIILRAVRV